MKSALTLRNGNKTEQLRKKRLVEHHLTLLRAKAVDDVTPNLSACGGQFRFSCPSKKRWAGGENSQAKMFQDAVEEKDRQVW